MKRRSTPAILAALVCVIAPAILSAQEPRLTNLSVRTPIDGANPAIVGFTIGPSEQATVVLRAVGPSLVAFGVENALEDPRIAVFNATGSRIAFNDDYSPADAAAFAAVGAFPLRPGGKDAALVSTLPAGSYTVHVAGPAGARGEVLVEAYLSANGSARLTNLSARATIHAEGGLIAGVTVAPGTGRRRLLVRAIGPTLADFGVAGSSRDPQLEVFTGTSRVAENNNWAATATPDGPDWAGLTSVFLSSGAFPLARVSLDAAVVREFDAGNHTIVARASGPASAGVALVEIYEAPSAPDAGSLPALAVQEFAVREAFGANFFLQIFSTLRVVVTGAAPVTLRTLRFAVVERGTGTRINIAPVFPLNEVMPPGGIIELLRRGTPAETALYYEIDPIIEFVTAEITYTDAAGGTNLFTTRTRVARR
ncbi:MAG: hypothetical protein JNL39_11735 [Opitutaceae bacterium]|nr:hypothetical protein [Opitutaceae bacterium]